MKNLRQRVQAGFTLVELLIVVIILAILAAIVIPQFSSSTTDAKESALDVNLSAMRAAMELYKAQHKNIYPGVNVATIGAVACTGGTAGSGAVNTPQAFADQMLLASDIDGHTCSVGSTPGYKFGPYLRKGIPADPNGVGGNLAGAVVAGIAAVATPTGAPIVVAGTGGGWIYDAVSGQILMNSTAIDSRGIAWSTR
jgi:general secretion pathway protein G